MWFCCMSTSSRYPSIFLSRSFSSSYSLILPRSVSVYLSRLYYHISTFFFIWIFFYLDVMFDLYVIIVSSFFYIIRFFISKEISIHSYISLFPNFIFHFHCVPFRTSTGNTISSIQSLFSPSLTWSLCWFHVIYVKVLSLEVLSSAAVNGPQRDREIMNFKFTWLEEKREKIRQETNCIELCSHRDFRPLAFRSSCA